jgi:hypothetical protein
MSLTKQDAETQTNRTRSIRRNATGRQSLSNFDPGGCESTCFAVFWWMR